MAKRTATQRVGAWISAIAATLTVALAVPAGADEGLQPHIAALESRGRPPLDFVIEQLDRHDLVLFDDALHPAVEPFEFYQRLVSSAEFRKKAKHIFFEAFNIDHQRHLDAYLDSRPEDLKLLYPVFQNDYSGSGWTLQTCQSMADAYDAVIFLAPLEELRLAGTFDFIYTSEFKQELERRYGILHTEEQLRADFKTRGVETLTELIAHDTASRPERAVLESMPVGPIDAWRKTTR